MSPAFIPPVYDDTMNGVRGQWTRQVHRPASTAVLTLHDITSDATGLTSRCEYSCGCEWLIDGFRVWEECPGHVMPTPGAIRDPRSAAPSVLIAKYDALLPAEPPDLELAFDTEPLTGWRSFRVGDYQRRGGVTETRLASLTGREVWEPRRRAEARCLPDNHLGMGYSANLPQHEAPWPTCHCGIWATREAPASVREGVHAGATVLARVRLWGRVLEFERGWRAQYAYPSELLVGGATADCDEVAAELGLLYGVPSRVARGDDCPHSWVGMGDREVCHVCSEQRPARWSNHSPA